MIIPANYLINPACEKIELNLREANLQIKITIIPGHGTSA
jgi:hypothetical protein